MCTIKVDSNEYMLIDYETSEDIWELSKSWVREYTHMPDHGHLTTLQN